MKMDRLPISVLVIAEDSGILQLLREEAGTAHDVPLEISGVRTLSEAEDLLRQRTFNLLLIDLSSAHSPGLNTLHQLRRRAPEAAVLVLTGSDDDVLAAAAIRDGAQDSLTKGRLTARGVRRAMRHALERHALEQGLRKARADLEREVSERTAELVQLNRELRGEMVQRERVDADLREALAEVNLIFDSVFIGIAYVRNRVVVRANSRFCEMFDYPLEEVIGHSTAMFYPSREAFANLGSVAYPVLAQGMPYQTELQMRRRDNRVFWISLHGRALNPREPLSESIWAFEDITERRLVEERQRFTNAILATQQETSLDAIYVVDDNHRMVSFNTRFAEMWGIPKDVMESRSDDLAIRAVLDNFESPDEFLDGVRRLYQDREKKLHDELHLKGGRTIERYSSPMIDADGRYYGRVFYFRDVSERKRAEVALRQSHALLTATERIAGIGGFDWDIAGDKLIWSDETYRIFGRSPESYAPTRAGFLASVHPDDRKGVDDAIAASLAGEKPFDVEFRIVQPDGTERVIDAQGEIARDLTGKPLRMTGTSHDVTERKRAEQALLRVNRALKTLSKCNETLVHATDEAQLLNDMCRTIVEGGGYRMAWVGFANYDAAKTVSVAAHFGSDFLTHTISSWADGEHGRGPVGTAIREATHQLVSNTIVDPRFAQWRTAAIKQGYASVLALPLLSDGKAFGALCIHAAEIAAFDQEEIELLRELANDLAFGVVTLRMRATHERSAVRLQRSMEETVQAIAATVELRDPYTSGHQNRVADLASAIGRELHLREELVQGIHLAGVVHDLGKIQIPSELLSKPIRLTELEYEIIKTHAQAGYEILKDVDFPWPIAEIVRQHHERLDGSGYPRGLKDEQILIEAKILAVADTLEAMASARPYRPALGIEAALAEIARHRGSLYDPAAVDACERLIRERRFVFSENESAERHENERHHLPA
jgi:PAS domain S-box-containing protein